MARKGTTIRVTTVTHTTRARMSLRPRKRVSGAPDRSELLVAWLATNASLRGVLMVALFKLRIRRYKVRKERTTLPERCPPSWLSSHYHNTFPPKNIRGQCFEGMALLHVQTSTTSLTLVLHLESMHRLILTLLGPLYE